MSKAYSREEDLDQIIAKAEVYFVGLGKPFYKKRIGILEEPSKASITLRGRCVDE